ncbi:DUF2977 domain-containing protein [Staphylococcus nepalensis]|uniref:DUF2977 domain-containing protein n=1 Tax=Staphylococcus nepalensis TaxID=214473 RepID=UPI003517CE57
MKVTINDKNEITSFVVVGNVDYGIEIDDSNVELLKNFETEKYILTKNNEILLNKNKINKEE